ncbi:hypothetical protein [Pseudomonas sp. SO81]|uniref:hypothetical protein n=1 Tax=Pseudomonas sp. SO81 TaxID=2983246 RepID=UPI0025A4AD49|nr:hypothetical protein [Pseudomonas sp. SO81]
MASTDSHSCVVYLVDPQDGKKGTVVPDRFRRLAIADGCGVVGLESADEDGGSQEELTGLIVAAIAAVMERQDPAELGGDGRAKVGAVAKQAGFKVTKVQFDEAWPKYVDGLGADDEDKDGE